MDGRGAMQAHYDPEADTATIYLQPQPATTSKPFTAHTQPCTPLEFEGRVSPLHLHFDADDRLMAIEVPNASRTLPEELLAAVGPQTVSR